MTYAHDRPHASPTARGVIIEGSSHICIGEGLAAQGSQDGRRQRHHRHRLR